MRSPWINMQRMFNTSNSTSVNCVSGDNNSVVINGQVAGNQPGILGNGMPVQELRSLPEFSGIQAGGVFIFNLAVGPYIPPMVTAESNLLPYIKTMIDDGVLCVYLELGVSIAPTRPIVITCQVPTLDGINLSGSAQLTVSGKVINPGMIVDLSGTSLARLDVEAQNVCVDLSGTARLTVCGECNNVSADCSGATTCGLGALKAVKVRVDLSGTAAATVRASECVIGSASGCSGLTILGNPARQKVKTSGLARVSS